MSSRRARLSATPILRAASLAVLSLAFAVYARAATPGSGTISLGMPSVSWTGSITGAGSGENTCVNGVSCDSFKVVLAPGNYTGKQVTVQISWTVPTYDYDLYVHEDSLTGPGLPPSAGGPPGTSETVHIGIDPPVVVTQRVWWAHIQAATVPPLQTYQGTAQLVSLPASPAVTYLTGNATFSHTVPLYARATVRTEEPSVRVDVRGNCYVGGIRGVPAGVDMWRFDLNPSSPTFDPEMRNGAYLGQPDAFQQMGAEDSTAGGADGGGDIEIATSFPTNPDSTPVVTMVSLAVADISSSLSGDKGTTWQHNAAAADIPSDDRQWIEDDGPNTVYLFYRAPVPTSALFCQKSTDHGFTYGAPVAVLDSNNPISTTPGYIDVDHANGYVYISHENSNAMYVSRSTDGGTTWTTHLVDGLTGHGHLFDPVKVGDDGTVYTAWSDDRHIYYSYSGDHGDTWSVPAIVENPDSTLTNVFPWLEAGSAGRVDFVWYGTQSQNTSAAEWNVYFAQCLNANSANPVMSQQRISDHVIHGSNISEGGLTGSANRNLGDYFQVAYDPQGAAVVSFADDHNDFDGNTYVVRQLDGTGLLASANGGTGQVNPVPRTDMPFYSWSDPEVTDPVHDATIETQPVPTDNPFDIVSIQYFADENGPNAPYLGARMKVSSLTAGSLDGTWRIAFTADAPWAVDQLPNGVSDHGNMFYLLASDSAGAKTFSYGTAYRDSLPATPVSTAYAMAYNAAVGVADSGYIDTTTSTVTVKVALAKINALIPVGDAPIGQGSWLSGLRGSAASLGAGPRDQTRGGLFNFFVNFGGTTAVGPGGSPLVLALRASPNPSRAATTLFYSMPRAGQARLAIYDVRGRLVDVLRSGKFEAGVSTMRWDGRTSAGSSASEGVYFAALETGSGERTVSRFVRLR
jgi:hypothetical protein